MDSPKKFQATKVIDAPAEAIFALLADPDKHSTIDGGGMLRGVEGDSAPLTAVGQSFTMNMFQDAFGPYRMINTVSSLEPGTSIGWSPAIDPSCELASNLGEVKVGGHTFTYDLKPVEGGTEVTETYDWSAVTNAPFLEMLPIVKEEDLKSSLDNLAAAVEK